MGAPAQPLGLEAEKSLPDLQLALIFAILTTARPETSAPRSGKALLPRNFKLYPDARSAVRSQMELIHHKPFFREWLDVDRSGRWRRRLVGHLVVWQWE